MDAASFWSARRGSSARRVAAALAWLALARSRGVRSPTAHLSHGLVLCHRSRRRVRGRAIAFANRSGGNSGPVRGRVVVGFVAVPPAREPGDPGPPVRRGSSTPRACLRRVRALRRQVARVSGGAEEAIPIPDRYSGGVAARARRDARRLRGGRVLLFVPFAFRYRRRRYLIVAFVARAASRICCRSGLLWRGVVPDLVLRLPFGDVYLHNPGRLRYLIFLVGPALGAVGLQGFLDRRPSFGRPPALARAGLGAVPRLPAALGARPGRLWSSRSVVLCVRCCRGVRSRQAVGAGRVPRGPGRRAAGRRAVVVDVPRRHRVLGPRDGRHRGAGHRTAPVARRRTSARYLSPGPIAAERCQRVGVSGGSLPRVDPPAAYFNKGYLFSGTESDWPALLLGRSVLFKVPDTLGYSPVQLPGYWAYVHATNRLPVFYNAAVIQVPDAHRPPTPRRQVPDRPARDPVAPAPGVSGRTLETEGAYRLVEIDGTQPRASVVPSWTVVSGERAALDAVLEPGFDPAAVAVLASEPGLIQSPPGPAGSATYQEVSPEDVRIRAEAAVPSILVVRNAWDDGWSATLDGRAVPVLRADAFLQGIAIPAGSHDVRLTYREPAIGRGVALSALVWLGFLVALAVVILRARGGLSAGVGAGRHAGAAAADRARPRKPAAGRVRDRDRRGIGLRGTVRHAGEAVGSRLIDRQVVERDRSLPGPCGRRVTAAEAPPLELQDDREWPVADLPRAHRP